jgi:hypothetical protein
MRYFPLLLCLLAAEDKTPAGRDTPAVLYAVPLAVAPGYHGKLTLRGLRLDGVTAVKAADPKVTVKLAGKPKASKGPNNYPPEKVGDGELEVELGLPQDFAAGHVELVAVGPKGEWKPYRLAVDPSPVVAEKEPNGSFDQAQELALPAVVVGAIGQERDVDVFRFAGKAGEKVRVEVVAARLGSPVDGFVTVYDAGRQVVGSCDDANGSPDPVLTVTLPRDGAYYVALIDAHDGGGPMFPYRMRVAKEK